MINVDDQSGVNMHDSQPLSHEAFIDRIIDDGQAEVRERFNEPEQKLRLDGCIDGFEACRRKSTEEIIVLRDAALERKRQAYREEDPRYWYYLERHGQIEFVLGTLSSLSVITGGPCHTTIYSSHVRKTVSVLGLQPPFEMTDP